MFCSEWKSNVICGSTIFDALTILGLPSPCAEHIDQFLLGLCVIDPCAVDYHSWVKLKTQAMKCHNPASLILKWSMKRTFAIGSPCKHTAKCSYMLKPYIDIYRKPQGSSPMPGPSHKARQLAFKYGRGVSRLQAVSAHIFSARLQP